jgi:hypothetical protein
MLLAKTAVPGGKAAVRQMQVLLLMIMLMPQVPLLLLLLSS